jgi:photosystem II stability/assembly factor-like uncharacterized protein
VLNLLNIGKLKMSAAFLAAAFVFAGCFQDPMSSAPVRPVEGDVHLQLHMAVSGVDKLAKGNAITLNKLIITLTSNATPADTVRDTIMAGTYGLGTNAAVDQPPISKNYTLKSLRTWKVVAVVRDTRDSLIHHDSATTPTLYSADTAAVSLNLSSRYAMYEAKFQNIPDSINSASGGLKQKLNLKRLVLKIDGVAVMDSTIPVGYFTALQTHTLSYDYVSTSTKTPVASGTSQNLNAVHFASATHGFAVGGAGALSRTTDGGLSWSTTTLPSGKALRAIHFLNATTGWIGGDSVVYRTTDGGANWSLHTSAPFLGSTSIRSIAFVSSTLGYALTANGSLYKSTDGGATWNSYLGVPVGGGMSFASATTGWMVGRNGAGSPVTSNIRKTTDGGSSFLTQTSPSTKMLHAVHAVNANIAIAVGDSLIVRTTNGGVTWDAVTNGVPANRNFKSVYFLDAATGFAVGENGVILSTNDTGASWTQESTPSTQPFNGVGFFGGKGFIVGNAGTLLTLAGPKLVEMLAYGPMGNWNTALPLFSGSKYVHAVSGVDANVSLNLSWVGPTTGTGSITATLGRVGKVTIIGTLPGTTMP